MKEEKQEEASRPFDIQDCKFFECALNTGYGGCVSTLTVDQKCSSIPDIFKDK